MLIVSTLIAGAAIGIAGVLLPVIIRRDFPHRLGLMTGLYTMVLSIGGASAAGLTPILERHTGSWNVALAVWSSARHRRRHPVGDLRDAERTMAFKAGPHAPLLGAVRRSDGLVRHGVHGAAGGARLHRARLAANFAARSRNRRGRCGRHHVIVDRGADAHVADSRPVLATRLFPAGALVLAVLAASLAGFTGLLYGPPGSTPFWGLVLGLGQGGVFGLALLFISLRSPTSEAAAMLSGMAQSIGYLGASLGPLAVSLLRDVSEGPAGPEVLFATITLLAAWCGLLAARPRQVLSSVT